MTQQEEALFQQRLARHRDELRWLYMELYDNGPMFDALCGQMHGYAETRAAALKARDAAREADPDWYKRNDLLGMMLYVHNFGGTLQGVESHLDYIQEPLLASPRGKSDGGYAVADFRTIQPELGTMEDFNALTSACHQKGISVCLDFVMNHTSEEHEWARRARAGEKEYQDRYFFFDDDTIPNQYEQTCPQVFPTTAPGNFTWLPDCRKMVMTTFYPYQWDLNYANPVVFNEMAGNLLYLVNQGVDVVRLDAVPYIWKQLGTSCRNLPQVHTIVRMIRMICEIVCPSVLLLPAQKVPERFLYRQDGELLRHRGAVQRRPPPGGRSPLRHHGLPLRHRAGRLCRGQGRTGKSRPARPDPPRLHALAVGPPCAVQRRRDRSAQRLQLQR